MKTALLLVDLQNDYFPGGKMSLTGSLEAARQARRLLEAFREQDRPRVHIQHVALDPEASFFLPDTEGVRIHASVQPLAGETVIRKHHPNAFRETDLLDHLRGAGIERLVICGMMTHMCVEAAVRAAADYGFEVLAAAEACATRALSYGGVTAPAEHVQAACLAAFRAYGQVLTTDAILEKISHD